MSGPKMVIGGSLRWMGAAVMAAYPPRRGGLWRIRYQDSPSPIFAVQLASVESALMSALTSAPMSALATTAGADHPPGASSPTKETSNPRRQARHDHRR